MSYVLDALRKSAQQGQTASPHGAGMLAPIWPERSRGIGLRQSSLAGMALAVAAAGALGWMWSRQRAVDPAATAVIAAAAPPAAPTKSMAALKLDPTILKAVPPATPPASAPAASAVKKSTSAKARTRPPAPRAPKADKAVADARAPKPTGGALPDALRRQLPKLAVGGYILDEQFGSSAIIDGKVLRIGDEAAPGVRVEKIDGEGVAFSYRGYRFRR